MADNAALSSAADTEWIALGQFTDTTKAHPCLVGGCSHQGNRVKRCVTKG
jgi:hypothetical protein